MSNKKTPRQSTLVSFFKKTPSQESPIISRHIDRQANVPAPSPSRPSARTPVTKLAGSKIPDDDEDDADEDSLQNTRSRKRRKTRLYDSDEDFLDPDLDDQDMIDVLSSATSMTARSEPKTLEPPPRIMLNLESSTARLATFMSGADAEPASSSSISPLDSIKPKLSKETSSRVSAIVPMSKQDQLVEGGYDWLKPGNIKDADGNRQGTSEYNPRTLYIPPAAASRFGNFEKQFWEHKSRNFDSIVFFQKGKFYELYEEDAVIAHQLFDWKMSGGRAGTLRMAGVPDYTFDSWAGEFVAKGYRVARVDQMESILGKDLRDRGNTGPKEKIVRRELTQVLTQGTLVDGNMLHSEQSTFVMSIKEICDTDTASPSFGIAFADTGTGVFCYSFFDDDMARSKLDTILSQIRPRELVLEKGRMTPATTKCIKLILPADTMYNWIKPETEFWDEERTLLEMREARYFGNVEEAEWPKAVQIMLNSAWSTSAFGALLWYLRNLKLDRDLCSLANFSKYDPLQARSSLVLDGQSLVNLELFNNTEDGTSKGSLFALINHCNSPFGKRLLKQWLCHPLQSPSKINARLDVVDYLNTNLETRDVVQKAFSKLPDLERILSRLHCGRCKVSDFVRVLEGFQSIQNTLTTLRDPKMDGSMLTQILDEAPDMQEKLAYWRGAFDWDEARGSRDEKKRLVEGVINPTPGAEAEFDESRAHMDTIEAALEPLLKQYQKELKSSKIRFATIGNSKEIYQIEVPATIKVPNDWSRLSATKAVTRYWSPEVKELVTELLETRELHKVLVDGLEGRFYQKFDQDYKMWSAVVRAVAQIDCLYSLAISSHILTEPACRPIFEDSTRTVLDFQELRHPAILPSAGSSFIPNDVQLGGSRPKMSLLTGPNMAGKSTLLRSTCIGVILAQLGHYVPAKSARITPIDQVSVRTGGAKDNITGSQSTFMVELSETSTILSSATDRSLVILDELGRGTSTFDGMAIACSVLHHLATYKGCIGFFSTHYSNLVEEFTHHPEVKFQNMDFLLGEDGRDVTFLYKLVDGVCRHSHGLNVARMAGIQESVIDAAAKASTWFDSRASAVQAEKDQEDALSLGLLLDLERLKLDTESELTEEQVRIILEHARNSVGILAA